MYERTTTQAAGPPGTTRGRRPPRRGPVLTVLVAAALAIGAIPGAQPASASAGGFPDVPSGRWFSDPVAWMLSEGLTDGVGQTGQFMPDRSLTRGEMATFLYRYAGEPPVSGDQPFPDVPDGAFFADPVRWLLDEGLTTGVGDTGLFMPHVETTRAHMGTFLYRFAGEPAVSGPQPFPDVPAGAYFAAPVRWLLDEGITTGVGDTGQFQPHRDITRAEMATFLWRFADRPDPGVTPVGEWRTSPLASPGFPASDADTAFLTDVRLSAQPGFDRIVLEFTDGDVLPAWRVSYQAPPILEQPSGLPADIDGDWFLELRVTPSSRVDLGPPEFVEHYDGPTRIELAGGAAVVEIALVEDHEGNLAWVAGVDGPRPFAIGWLGDPTRLVVDVLG